VDRAVGLGEHQLDFVIGWKRRLLLGNMHHPPKADDEG
jgi:hypothetical protein